MTSRLACLRLAVALLMGRADGRGRTCREFLERHGQPPDVIERFWEPVILATLNAPVREASAELLVAVMRLAFLGSTSDAQMLIPTVGLSALVEPFPAWLADRGGRVLLSTSVDRLGVDVSTGRPYGVLSSGETLEVDHVISGVPQRALERLLRASGMEHDLADAPHMSPIVSVYLWYDRRWMPGDFTAALGTTVQWVFDKRRIRPGLVALTVSAGSELVGETSDGIIERCDRELRTLFPAELHGVHLQRGLVIKEKQATPLLTPAGVLDRASTTALASATPWLTIAGDWTQTGLPATIEGAVQSGFSAASAWRS